MKSMTRRNVIVTGVIALAGLLVPGSPARADRADELRERFKGRYERLLKAKGDGAIGETTGGMVEAVNGKSLDDALKKLVDEENADRRELYKIIAEKEQTTEQKVAERNAARNFEKARSGEFLKDRDGTWKQKK
jgi:uncharacterized protein